MAPRTIISALKSLQSAPVQTKIRLFYERKLYHFRAKRRLHPFASEGEGSDYIVARFNNQDVDAYRRGEMTGRKLLSCCVLKVGHSSRMETRQTEYRGCDEDATQTHVWICHYIVQRRCYAERFLHLFAFREGGVRDVRRCPCGVFHHEYFNFPSIGGLANLESMLVKVLHAMREGVHRIYQSNKNLKSRNENFKTCATSSPVGLEVVEREL
ncbi:hypothetical protein DFH07DRAFT_764721 [Mycena maculata]|uniref:Bacteriophage T5 Orf172 DNA-binding domain-containing protein n=1 Tax=Mycena maculata TaxID=230809 RepID=A0AAD7KDP4_9AGAR|nr:hypothetical protein DFH07DRAFT_764721 [Mycena maculata]